MRPMRISVSVEADGGDVQETEELTRALQDELLLLDSAASVERPEENTAVAGAKSGAVAVVGTLIVTGVFSGPALNALVALVGEWRQRAQARKVEIVEGDDSLVVEGLSAGDQKALVEAWLQRRSDDRTGGRSDDGQS